MEIDPARARSSTPAINPASPGRHGHPPARRHGFAGGPARQAQSGLAVHGRRLGVPGRRGHDGDGDGEAALRSAACARCARRPGIELGDHGALIPFSRWITPAQVKIRFDTWFFLAAVPPATEARIDGGEVVDARWYAPADALAAGARDELMLVFPTIKHLEQLTAFATARALVAHAYGREVRPVQPQVLMTGETARIVLPGEPGYTE